MNQKKAKLYITFPGHQFASYKINLIQIKQVQQKLKNNHFVLISTPEEFMMPDSLIFDKPYYLTKKGVDLLTGLLIRDLKIIVVIFDRRMKFSFKRYILQYLMKISPFGSK